MRNGIAGRIAIIFSVLVLVATGTVGYMVYQEARASLIASSTDRLAHAADVIRVRLSAHVEAVAKDVWFLASTPPVQGMVRARLRRGFDPETALLEEEWRDQLAEVFEVFLRNRASYTQASFVDLRGRDAVLVHVGRRADSLYRAANPGSAEKLGAFLPPDSALVAGGLYVSGVEMVGGDDGGYGEPVLHVAVPVFDARGTAFGAVMISVALRGVLRTLASLAGPDKSLYLANADGELLRRPSGPFATAEGSTPRSLQAAFPGVDVRSGGVQVLERRRDGNRVSGIAYFERLPYDPSDVGQYLTVAVASPHADILGGVDAVRERSILITLLFSLGGTILALGFSRFLTRPLSRITHALSRFGEDDWNLELPVGRKDEIGVLARAFDTMASQMRYQMKVLEDKERRQGIILETAAEGIIVADSRGIVENFNRAAERLFGFSAEEVVGAHVSLLMPHYGRNGTLAGATSWKEVGTGREVLTRRKDGSYMPVSLSVSAFAFASEDKYALFLEDITERKEYEAALQSAKEQAEEMARLKTAFLANMSHEIRTPLTAVIGFASTLAKEVAEEHRSFAHLIERSGRRLMATLNAVLSLAQLEAKQMKVELDTLEVEPEVEDVIQLFEQQAVSKGLTLSMQVSPAARGAQARLDRGALGSVLQNLVGNAVKFTERGGVDVHVDVERDRVCIRVRDTGIGIADVFLPHLFEAFRQESTGLQRTHEGSGLGLSLTKRLVELMGGEISVESVKGQGSTFIVAFPLVNEMPPPTAEVHRASALLETAGGATDAQVLVVEDNADTAYLVGRVLEDLCDVTVALDAEEALRYARTARYDLVLLDLNLGSGATGVDVLEALREDAAYDGVPVVALTAYALPGDRDRFLRLGFDDYVSKPFAPDALIELVAQLLPQRSAEH